MRLEGIIFLVILVALLVAAIVGIYIIGKWLYHKLSSDEEMDMETNQNIQSDEHFEDKTKNITKDSKMSIKINFINNVGIRFIIIGVIAFLMLIPLDRVRSIVDERSSLHKSVLSNIASQWGAPQSIIGPAIVLPIVEKYDVVDKVTDDKGKEKTVSKIVRKNKSIVILPNKLHKDIGLSEHYRYRGIYKSLVYSSEISIDGDFVIPDISKLSDNLEKVRYDKAFLVMGLSDTKAIEDVSSLSFGTSKSIFEPGVKLNIKGLTGGFHAPISISESNTKYPFSFKLKANGSSYIRFSAFGKDTDISVHSSWKHPSFQGAILPADRNISADGFKASWKIPSLARSFPQSWIHEDNGYNVGSLLTGVDLYEPVALYSLVNRAIKYGVLFIILTFLTFSIFEITQKSKLHYVQYVLIGLSLGMFFLVLLSLSEHIKFINAYLISSAITVLSISVYAWFSNRSLKQFVSVFTLLSALYVIMYSLLQMEDYALLMGTGLLLAVLFVLMWITRNLRAE